PAGDQCPRGDAEHGSHAPARPHRARAARCDPAAGAAPMTTARTLRGEATVEGAGLFTGAPCRMVVRPEPEAGVWFLRGAERIEATVASLSSEPAHPALGRSTNLACRGKTGAGARALTVEHVLS